MSRRRWMIGAFCSIYLIVQLFLILSSFQKPDKRFGFWMFPESTYFQMKLERELANGRTVEAQRGRWTVHAAGLGGETGRVSYRWRTFVRKQRLGRMEEWRRAQVGICVTLLYLEKALDHVVESAVFDRETKMFRLTVEYEKAGGERGTVRFEARNPRFETETGTQAQ